MCQNKGKKELQGQLGHHLASRIEKRKQFYSDIQKDHQKNIISKTKTSEENLSLLSQGHEGHEITSYSENKNNIILDPDVIPSVPAQAVNNSFTAKELTYIEPPKSFSHTKRSRKEIDRGAPPGTYTAVCLEARRIYENIFFIFGVRHGGYSYVAYSRDFTVDPSPAPTLVEFLKDWLIQCPDINAHYDYHVHRGAGAVIRIDYDDMSTIVCSIGPVNDSAAVHPLSIFDCAHVVPESNKHPSRLS